MMNQLPNEDSGIFLIINNIPKDYRSSNLRDFFSCFIETGGFICFHYRHRPEVQKPSNPVQNEGSKTSRQVSNCCVVKVIASRADKFIKDYDGEHWLDDKGMTRTTKCFIKKISVSESSDFFRADSASYKKGTISENLPLDREDFTHQDLESLIEMHPPSFMPNGNVGTKTNHFLEQIRSCRLPPAVISKLGLKFPRNRSKKIYSNVPYEYKKNKRKQPYSNPAWETISVKKPWCSKAESDDEIQKDDECEEEEDSEEEEWDRVEALNDDVSGQDRNKERLFEDKIELKWEKGGSGLVFYTDAQFWDAKEGDFDAKTADDWDIDMRIYEGKGLDSDKDMRDLVRMKLEEKRRNGTEADVDRLYDFAAFEKYNKGVGTKILKAQGWKQGQGVGRNAAGIAEPIPNDGQLPFDKKGFGYRGEKLNRKPVRQNTKRRRRSVDDSDDRVFISTIFDDPKIVDPSESVLASTSFARLKYRQNFHKESR